MSGYFRASATATDAPHECPRTMAFETLSLVSACLISSAWASGGPDHIARAIAVTEAGSVENDDSEMFCRKINQTAGFKVFNHAAVAVQQNQRVARAPFNVVEPNATYIEEAAGRWIVTLRFLCKMTID